MNLNMQPPDVEDPRDDEDRMIDALKEIARQAATRRPDAPFEDYQPTPEQARDWKPHEWVIDALLAAYKMGENDGIRATAAVANQVEETYRTREMQFINSTVLAIMEQLDMPTFVLDLKKVMTVHDRKVINAVADAEQKVTFVMEDKH